MLHFMSYSKDIIPVLFIKTLLPGLQTGSCIGCPCEGFDSRGDKGRNGRRLRLPCTGHSWFLSAPAPNTGHRQTHHVHTSVTTYLRKKMLDGQGRKKKREWETAVLAPMQENERRCYRCWSRNAPAAPWKAHTEAEIWMRAGKTS